MVKIAEENEIIVISGLEEIINKLIGFSSSKSEIITPSSVDVSFKKVENGFKGERKIDFFHQILDSEAPRSYNEVESDTRHHKPRGICMTQKGRLSYNGITFKDLIDKIFGNPPYKEELQSEINSLGFLDKDIIRVSGVFHGGNNPAPKMISFSNGTYQYHPEPWYEFVFNSTSSSYQFKINKIGSDGMEKTSPKQWEIQKDNSLGTFQSFLNEIFIKQGVESCFVETTLGCCEGTSFIPYGNEPLQMPNDLVFYTLLTETPYLALVNEVLSLVSQKPICSVNDIVKTIYLETSQFVERKQLEGSPIMVKGSVNSENKAHKLLTSTEIKDTINTLNNFVQSIKEGYSIQKAF